MKLSNFQSGSSLSLLIIIVLVIFLVGIGTWYYVRVKNIPTTAITPASIISQVTPKPTATPSSWKTYRNVDFNLDITYPAKGVITEKEDTFEGECGNAIKIDSVNKNILLVDNFYKIKRIDWDGNIESYLMSQGAAKVYDTHIVTGTNADEALALDNLAKGVEYAVGMPPLSFVKAIFKKGSSLYVVSLFQYHTNYGGCTDPLTLAPDLHPEITKLKWDITTSLKFL